MPQGIAQGQPEGDNWLKLADDENKVMMGTPENPGIDIPSTPKAPKEHTAIHVAFSQSDDAQKDDKLLERLFIHIQGEEKEQGLNTAGVSTKGAEMAPMPPPETGVAPEEGQNAS